MAYDAWFRDADTGSGRWELDDIVYRSPTGGLLEVGVELPRPARRNQPSGPPLRHRSGRQDALRLDPQPEAQPRGADLVGEVPHPSAEGPCRGLAPVTHQRVPSPRRRPAVPAGIHDEHFAADLPSHGKLAAETRRVQVVPLVEPGVVDHRRKRLGLRAVAGQQVLVQGRGNGFGRGIAHPLQEDLRQVEALARPKRQAQVLVGDSCLDGRARQPAGVGLDADHPVAARQHVDRDGPARLAVAETRVRRAALGGPPARAGELDASVRQVAPSALTLAAPLAVLAVQPAAHDGEGQSRQAAADHHRLGRRVDDPVAASPDARGRVVLPTADQPQSAVGGPQRQAHLTLRETRGDQMDVRVRDVPRVGGQRKQPVRAQATPVPAGQSAGQARQLPQPCRALAADEHGRRRPAVNTL